jgi:hypothetical protein
MKWEYKAVKLVRPIESDKGIDLTNALCELGEKEWELVQCDLDHNTFIFKRPIKEHSAVKQTFTKEQRRIIDYFGGKIA